MYLLLRFKSDEEIMYFRMQCYISNAENIWNLILTIWLKKDCQKQIKKKESASCYSGDSKDFHINCLNFNYVYLAWENFWNRRNFQGTKKNLLSHTFETEFMFFNYLETIVFVVVTIILIISTPSQIRNESM